MRYVENKCLIRKRNSPTFKMLRTQSIPFPTLNYFFVVSFCMTTFKNSKFAFSTEKCIRNRIVKETTYLRESLKGNYKKEFKYKVR